MKFLRRLKHKLYTLLGWNKVYTGKDFKVFFNGQPVEVFKYSVTTLPCQPMELEVIGQFKVTEKKSGDQ